jgi:hypothetical protein
MSLSSFEDWRARYLLRNRSLSTVADLGYGVLDAAIVEAAASIIDLTAKDSCVFVSCLDYADKEFALRIGVEEFNNERNTTHVYLRKPSIYANFPAAVIAYNVEESFARKILTWTPLEEHGVRALKGLNTSDDERYLRTAWEVTPSSIGKAKTWSFLAKGGEWNPYWDDIHLLVNWKDKGKSILLSGGDIRNPGYYLRPGLTYPLRTTSSFGPRVMPEGCVFSTGGLAIMFDEHANPLCYLGLMLSRAGQFLVEMSLGGGDSSASGTAARNYTNGMVNRLPFPLLRKNEQTNIAVLVRKSVSLRRRLFEEDETSRNFVVLRSNGYLKDVYIERVSSDLEIFRQIADFQEKIELAIDELLNLNEREKIILSEVTGPSVYEYSNIHPSHEASLIILSNFSRTEGSIIETLKVERGRGARFVTKNTQMVDRKLELIAHLHEQKLQVIIDVIKASISTIDLNNTELQHVAVALCSYCLGSLFGRWDIRYATGEKPTPELPDPFAPLPVCPPGMLQNAQGLPAAPEDVPTSYPLRISWPGILVDDEGHAEDIVGRAREAIRVIWGERAEAIEQEACEILGVKSLRDYFARPAGFFADHLARYSKSRRQAPIYWPLSTPSGSYTLWLYYHRLSDQTLYSCVNDFVEPKLKLVGEQLAALSQKAGRSAKEERELERLDGLRKELIGLREELLRVASFWKPNLNDGVQITAAPLWRLFQHKPWQKRLKETWERLEQGEYDWAHLAYSIWPERVREKCQADKSLAIAHDLEALYVAPPASAAKGRGRAKKAAAETAEDLFEGE